MRHSAEQIILELREAEVPSLRARDLKTVCKQLVVT